MYMMYIYMHTHMMYIYAHDVSEYMYVHEPYNKNIISIKKA